MNITSRSGFLLAFVASLGLMGAALYMQHVMHLEPCPLCIFQRMFVIAIGVVALLGVLHNPGRVGTSLYAILIGLLALGGGAVATRQVWLQHLPADQVPECGPSLDYMLEAFPLNQTLQLVFKGSGECAAVDWTFLGFSIAEWMLVVFTGFLLYAIALVSTRFFK
jgi:disulfide bond formation protein DsbB